MKSPTALFRSLFLLETHLPVAPGNLSARSLVVLLARSAGAVLLAVSTVRAQPTDIPHASGEPAGPTANLVPGGDGNSYGTTRTGGAYGEGTVFRVAPTGATTVLYDFTGGSDGGAPSDSLVVGHDGDLYGTTTLGGSHGGGTAFRVATAGGLTTLFSLGGGTSTLTGFVRANDGRLYGTGDGDGSTGIFKLLSHPAYFDGQAALGGGVYYLSFPNGNFFGYYAFLPDANYLYHFDLGFEYVFDAHDGQSGVYFYDFASDAFFYTSPSFPFPYLYDFSLDTVLYYYPDPKKSGRYNTDGRRYFYRFDTGRIIVK